MPSTSSSTRSVRRRERQASTPDAWIPAVGARGLSRLRLVAVEDRQAGEQGAMDGARRARLRGVGLALLRGELPRPRLNAVRPGAVVSAGARASRWAALRR